MSFPTHQIAQFTYMLRTAVRFALRLVLLGHFLSIPARTDTRPSRLDATNQLNTGLAFRPTIPLSLSVTPTKSLRKQKTIYLTFVHIAVNEPMCTGQQNTQVGFLC